MADFENMVFPNRNKTADKHPDLRGVSILEGFGEVEVAGWRRKTKNGQDYLYVRLSKPRSKPGAVSAPRPAPAAVKDDLDDEVPF